jgi:hypothetical protein
LKLGSKKSWQFVSAVSILLLATQAAPGTNHSGPANELTLAGLRPGREKLPSPQKVFRQLDRDESVTDALLWGDICTHRELRVELDANNMVQTVTVDNNYKPEIMAKCVASVLAPSRLKLLATAHGLKLGDSCDRTAEIYGKPESKSASVRGTEQLELSLYSFDWAGPGVPQVMEVSCNDLSQVVAITLAASTL